MGYRTAGGGCVRVNVKQPEHYRHWGYDATPAGADPHPKNAVMEVFKFYQGCDDNHWICMYGININIYQDAILY